jgi:Cft2 family RNA processing exonuclease
MQVGPSRELFELWAPDARNGLIITGYSIEGTLARVSAKWLCSGYLLFLVYNMRHATMDICFLPRLTLQIHGSFYSVYFLRFQEREF